jgi:cytochrome o ubiquinol oxidase subunit 2
MAGMRTRLHLLADEPGTYVGQNQQYTGRGYANMHFQVKVVSREEFQSWVQKAKESSKKLDLAGYKKLAKPSSGYYPVTYFSSVKPDLFEYIIRQFNPTMGKHPGTPAKKSASTHTGIVSAEEN